MAHAFYTDAANRSERRNRQWYQDNLLRVLHAAKEKQVREIDASITLAEELMRYRRQHIKLPQSDKFLQSIFNHITMERLNEPLEPPTVVPMPDLQPTTEDCMMLPVEQEVLDILHKSSEKGAVYKYLKERYKKAPEDKFVYRVATSWDYGWQQRAARQRARDVNRGRCFVLRHTFYRRSNAAPDPPHYASPSGGQTSICSEYSCSFN